MKKKLCMLLVVCIILQFGFVAFALEVSPQVEDILPESELVDDIILMDAPLNPEFSEYHEEPVYSKDSSRDRFQGATGLKVSPANINTNYDILDGGRVMTRNVPSSFDLRSYNRVTPVKDQGPNGSCWAFATYGSAESTLLSSTGRVYDFSEKNLRNSHQFDWAPDQGGTAQVATAYLARWSGPISEADEPYSPYDFTSPQGLSRVMNVDEVYYLPNKRHALDNDIIKREIVDKGAIYTSINGSTVYLNFSTMGHYQYGAGYGNHAVTIVGWNDNYSRYNFKRTPYGDGAWIVKNSWGKNWGRLGGYYYVSYYDPIIATNNAQFILKPKNDSQSLWSYDPLGMTGQVGNGQTGYFANVFGPARGNIQIDEVGFFVPSNNAQYRVYVADNVNRGSGLNNRRLVAEGTLDYAGYTTIELDRPVSVASGNYFAPIVELTTPGYSYPIPIEGPVRGYSSRARAQAGQSYISYNGSQWTDLTRQRYNTNVCLKAITSPQGYTPNPPNPPSPPTPSIVKVNKVELSADKTEIKIGEKLQLDAKVFPENATNKSLTWSLSNYSVASITQEGLLTAKNKGNVTAYAQAKDGSRAYGTINISIKDAIPPDSDEITTSSFRINPYVYGDKYAGKDLQVSANIKDYWNRNIYYASVYLDLIKPSGEVVKRSAYSNQYGNVSFTIYGRDIDEAGAYTLKFTAMGSGYKTTTKSIEVEIKDSRPTFNITVRPRKSGVDAGQRIYFDLQASYGYYAMSYVDYTAKVLNPKGEVDIEFNFKGDYYGRAYCYYTPARNVASGEYTLLITANKSGYRPVESSVKFNVNGTEIEEEIYKLVETNEAEVIINENKNNSNFVIYDVRTDAEYLESHIEGAIQYDYYKDDFREHTQNLDKDKIYLIYCRTQVRSGEVAEMMKKMGFKKIYWMNGGMTKWLKEGRSAVFPEYEKVLRINLSTLKNSYNAGEEVEANIFVKDSKGNNIRKAKVELNVFAPNGGVIESQNLVMGNHGEGVARFRLPQYSENGTYKIVAKATHNDFSPVEGIALFQVGEFTTTFLSFQERKDRGDFSHLSNDSFEYESLEKNYGKNLLQYRVLDGELNNKRIIDLVDTSKKTILVFGYPGCGPCVDMWKEMAGVDHSQYNFIEVVTSVSENPIETVEMTDKVLRDNNIMHFREHIYYDGIDKIWADVLNLLTTPNTILLDEEGRMVNIGGQYNKDTLKAFFDKTFREGAKPDPVEPNPEPVNKATPEMTFSSDVVRGSGTVRIETRVFDSNGNALTRGPIRYIVNWPDGRTLTYDRVLYYGKSSFSLTFYSNYPKGEYKLDCIYMGDDFEQGKTTKSIYFDMQPPNPDPVNPDPIKPDPIAPNPSEESLTYNERYQRGEFSHNQGNDLRGKLSSAYGMNLKDHTIQTMDGRNLRLGDLIDGERPTVIALGYPACGGCQGSWREFSKMDMSGFNFIEGMISGNPIELSNILRRMRLSNMESHFYFNARPIFNLFGANYVPVVCYLDKEGNVSNISYFQSNAQVSNIVTTIGDTISVK